ncbi:MAG: hypothetical protein RIF36_08090 [Imperialibacter sp.]|uniref:hypothetical protein n=1 Tax=Imperialibacter sp. TaxID=2038411 RepID=UPI0032ECE685
MKDPEEIAKLVDEHTSRIGQVEEDVVQIKSHVGLVDLEGHKGVAELLFKSVPDSANRKRWIYHYAQFLIAVNKGDKSELSLAACKIFEGLTTSILPHSITIDDFNVVLKDKYRKTLRDNVFNTGLVFRVDNNYEPRILEALKNHVLPFELGIPIDLMDRIKLAAFKFLYRKEKCWGNETRIINEMKGFRNSEVHDGAKVRRQDVSIPQMVDVTDLFIRSLLTFYASSD